MTPYPALVGACLAWLDYSGPGLTLADPTESGCLGPFAAMP